MTEEIWKSIHGASRYEVSNLSNFKSKTTGLLIMNRDKLKTHIGIADDNKKAKRYNIYKLIANLFVKNNDPIRKKIINHKDGNISNNIAENLEWIEKIQRCSKCKVPKEDHELSGNSQCKQGHNKIERERRKELSQRLIPENVFEGQKKCPKCKKILNKTEFWINRYNKNFLTSQCKDCNFYDTKQFIYNQKKIIGECAHCSETDLDLLQFDHINPFTKIKSVSQIRSIKLVEQEIKKCQLLCIMCHSLKSMEQFSSISEKDDTNTKIRKRNRDYVNNRKLDIGECNHCHMEVKDENLCCFHYDHINREEKFKIVSKMVGEKYSIKLIEKEIQKCQLLCAACHWKRTIVQMKWNDKLLK